MITYDTKDVDLPELDFNKVSIWLTEIVTRYDKRVGNVNYLFCNDDEILRVNRKFLNHDFYTDIITFDYTHRNKIGGDIFISLDTVMNNAEELGASYYEELLRVLAHGVLHLCGIDDKGPGEREIMESHENEALSLWKTINPLTDEI